MQPQPQPHTITTVVIRSRCSRKQCNRSVLKMHKFPPSLVDVDGTRYNAPVTVAIGPYHHGLHPGVLEAERFKHVAATQCMRDSSCSAQEMYNAVSGMSDVARRLYHHDEVAGIGNDDFLPMMFFDACFLVQFMRWYHVVLVAGIGNDDFLPMMFFDACFLVQFMRWYHVDNDDMDQVLVSYFDANLERISTDIMMLENQIPWVVVESIFSFMPPTPSPWPWENFVVAMRSGLKNRIGPGAVQDIVVDPNYETPHLLGLVRFYIVGNNKSEKDLELPKNKPMSLSISVAELADIGVTLVPKEMEAGLVDMGLNTKSWCFIEIGDLVVRPLFLTEANATWLVNMAAFELCKTPNFEAAGVQDEDSAVCSYLHLFAMLLDQKKHVRELQENHVIEGGGLTSEEALQFFTCIGKNMRLGMFYLDIIIKIENFKRNRSFLLRWYLFIMKNMNKIIAVISIVGAVVGILSSLQALKPAA